MPIKKYTRLTARIFQCCLMNDMEYKLNFILRGFVELSFLIVSLVFFEVIYSSVDQIAGWTKYEMFLLMTITNLLDAAITLFFHNSLWSLPKLINDGTLDFVLLKPVNKRFYLSCRSFVVAQLPNVILNIVLIFYFASKLPYSIDIGQILMFIVILLNGVFIMYNIFLGFMLVSFWVVKIDVNGSMFYQLFNIGNKPADLFPGMLKKLFTYVVPIFIAFSYPVLFIKGELNGSMAWICFGMSALLFIVTSRILKLGLAKYSSASS